jgi:hypothetical protein
MGTIAETTESGQRLVNREGERPISEAMNGSLLEHGHVGEQESSDWQEGRGDRRKQSRFNY